MLAAMLLVLTGLLATPQDAPVATAARQEGRALLLAAEAHLYRPETRGLVSLGFVVPYDESGESIAAMAARMGQPVGALPDELRMADVTVSWTEGAEPSVSVRVSDELPVAIQSIRDQLEAALPQMGYQMLSASLGRVVDLGRFLEHYDAELAGSADGLTQVRLRRKPGASEQDAPAPEALWSVDAEGRPVRSVIELTQSTPMGDTTLRMTLRHTWKPSGEDDGSLLLDRVTIEMDKGFMGSQTQTTTYHHERVGGFLVVTGITEEASGRTPAGELPSVVRETWLEDLSANGVSRQR